ncbi:MAG: DUF1007 family protein [Fibrobacter sp.]|nr:DUF1007 family protein [Fibrobacter sp.]
MCGLCASVAFAHPHVFVDAKVKVLFDESGLTGIQNHWVYDEIYSTATVATVDRDGDGKLSAKESEALKSVVLNEIAKSNYFNYIQAGSNFLVAQAIKDFKASVKNGRLVLDFVVGFVAPVGADYSMLVIVVADPSNYVQVTADMENADVAAPGTIDVEYFSDSLEGLSLFRAFLPYVEGLYMRFKTK